MENNDVFSKELKKAIKCDPFISLPTTGFVAKIGKRMMMFIFIGSLAGTGLLLNSCMVGYVATEPIYNEYSRPQRPSDLHVWINGDWVYNSRSHVYIQNAGYWAKPQQNRIYINGQWQSNAHGKYWEKGHWQKNGHEGNRHNH